MRKVIAITGALGLTSVLVLLGGCAASKALGPVAMAPLPLGGSAAPLERNHFQRDRSGSISEQGLREVLSAPVFLEESARVGVIQVASGYEPGVEPPVINVPALLTEALERSGLFEVATEVSADWPTDSGVSGLRELAARYRAEYLLLYRHRFVDETWTNAWGWASMLILPALFVPLHSNETAGVLEATLFDVKTGTILYTVFERVHARETFNVWHNGLKRRWLKERLLKEAAEALSKGVVAKTRFLVAARPAAGSPLASPPAEPSLASEPDPGPDHAS
jgi:hypothetical protein